MIPTHNEITTDHDSNYSVPAKGPCLVAPGQVREWLESWSSDEMEGVLEVNYEAKLFLFSHYADDCLSMKVRDKVKTLTVSTRAERVR
jgi:hypothetical protein